ncbi:murein transglycosylase A [Vogesella fluminis]|uniref:peptidoglycan lytic exotransglycosylase n=2 Tax=Vogesella fluminis TaxID=1069161 RepID=A0ABQ3H8L6_9NEIS|nr:MltA domain-containing protein [Vogesella fluminis]GHD74043.1 murein transglycosylase [Vogesella fluminis]
MLNRLLLSASLLWLAACSTVSTLPPSSPADSIRYQPAAFSQLPQWDSSLASESLLALRESCRLLAGRPQWQAVCSEAATLDAANVDGIRRFYESRFVPWQVSEAGKDSGLITGYYEPLLSGSRQRSAQTPYPVYGVPQDLLLLDISAEQRAATQLVVRRSGGNRLQVVAGKSQPGADELLVTPADFVIDSRTRTLKGRLNGNHLLPYYSRAEINTGKGVGSAPVLAWVEDETELFFLQVQGSGRIQLEDGSFLRVTYAEQNGHPYKSIGRWLIDQQQLTLAEASMQGIKGWLEANPQRRRELFDVNPSYVFFRTLHSSGGGPIGALGVPLTDGHSLAVDPRYIPLGAPVYLATTWPLDGSPKPLTRLMHAQDTGGAIRGAVRGDFFFGFGTEAGMYAGRMKQQGRFWLLLPRGMTPAPRP